MESLLCFAVLEAFFYYISCIRHNIFYTTFETATAQGNALGMSALEKM